MCDNTNLPLSLIMEEILKWEKPAERDKENEREREERPDK